MQLHTCSNKQVQQPTKRQQLIEQIYGENYLQQTTVEYEGTTTNKIKQPKNKEKNQKLTTLNNKTPVSRPTEVRYKNATTK